MSEKVEMRCAYEWTCPECGTDNFERAIVAELSEEDRSELLDEAGIDDIATGDFVTRPDEVTCRRCRQEFEAEDFPGPTWSNDELRGLD